MTFSKSNAEQQFNNHCDNVSPEEVNEAIDQGTQKMNSLADKLPTSLKDLWEKLALMLSLLADYSTGQYRDVPWRMIAAITGAVAYFVSPVDVIPDVIFGIGYIDDAFVLKIAFDLAKDDLDRYALWKKQQAS